jgi:epoxyqueuosine reductase
MDDELLEETPGGTVRPPASERPHRQGFYDIVVRPFAPRYFKTLPPEAARYWMEGMTDVGTKVVDITESGRARYRGIDEANPARTEFAGPTAATAHLKRLAKGLGADLVGVTTFKEEYCYADTEPDGAYLVMLAKEMSYDAVAQAPALAAATEMARVYTLLGRAIIALTEAIRALGYHARAHHPMSDDGKFNAGGVLFIPAAVDAGLGWMGKNTSMVTSRFGPRIRLGAVATDLPLAPDTPMSEGLCGDCNECIEACPVGALWEDSLLHVPRYALDRLKFDRCRPYYAETHGCAVCLAACPWSRRARYEAARVARRRRE